jgi:hypothetical protein
MYINTKHCENGEMKKMGGTEGGYFDYLFGEVTLLYLLLCKDPNVQGVAVAAP